MKIKNVAIYGAGEAGRQLLASVNINKYFNPVAFIDDNIDLQGTILAGVPVLS